MGDSSYDNGREQGKADSDRIEKDGYGVGDALNDLMHEATSWMDEEYEEGYQDGREE